MCAIVGFTRGWTDLALISSLRDKSSCKVSVILVFRRDKAGESKNDVKP